MSFPTAGTARIPYQEEPVTGTPRILGFIGLRVSWFRGLGLGVWGLGF